MSCWATGNHPTSRNDGVMCSNFLVPVIILQAKFCTNWSLSIFVADVFDPTEEQLNNLLITKAEIIICRRITIKAATISAYLELYMEVYGMWKYTLKT